MRKQTAVIQFLFTTLVSGQLSRDLLPGSFRTQSEIFENSPRHPIAFKEQSQEDVFGSDVRKPRGFSFCRGEPERSFNTRSVWKVARHFAGWKITHPILDLLF